MSSASKRVVSESPLSAFGNLFNSHEARAAVKDLSTNPDFDADEFLKKLSDTEAKFWLEAVVRDICEDKKIGLNYKTLFEEVINNDNLDATKKVEEVSR